MATATALEIEDVGSSNGTSINGNPMVGTLGLLDGDLVSFGSATCLVKRVGLALSSCECQVGPLPLAVVRTEC